MNTLLRALSIGIFLLWPAMADIIHWQFENSAFPNGGEITGSFSIDSSTGNLSAINVVTTSDVDFGGASYFFENATLSNGLFVMNLVNSNSPNLLGADAIVINFHTTLGTPGIDQILSASEGICNSTTCDGFSNARSLTVGDVTTSASTPEPSTAWLLMACFFVLPLVQRVSRRG